MGLVIVLWFLSGCVLGMVATAATAVSIMRSAHADDLLDALENIRDGEVG